MLRDGNGAFLPQLVAKHQTRFTGFDGKIPSLCARGMTTPEIQGHREEDYGDHRLDLHIAKLSASG